MNGGLIIINNRQRLRPLDTRRLRRLSADLISRTVRVENLDLGIQIVRSAQMIGLNETFLHHEGSTDVITFNYSDHPPPLPVSALKRARGPAVLPELHGEIFICVDEAVAQARRYRTTWQCELVRYVIHGLLHLLGHDDLEPAARRIMKHEENRLLKALLRRFPLSKPARHHRVSA